MAHRAIQSRKMELEAFRCRWRRPQKILDVSVPSPSSIVKKLQQMTKESMSLRKISFSLMSLVRQMFNLLGCLRRKLRWEEAPNKHYFSVLK